MLINESDYFTRKNMNNRRPEWLKVKAPVGTIPQNITEMLQRLDLHTVCQSANCPNMGECWQGEGATATFMLLGNICTRACKFCAVKTGNPQGVLDPHEPQKIATAVQEMQLDYVVLTSVDRDDLADEGAGQFAAVIHAIKQQNSKIIVEALTPDFSGRYELLEQLIRVQVDVFAHNIETVKRLTPKLRDRRSTYERSLQTLQRIKEIAPQQYTKSSIMVGCGEQESEVIETLQDLRAVNCDIVTFGQYLAPSEKHFPVVEYIPPAQFTRYEKLAQELGFLYVASGPLVRSSYRAGEYFIKNLIEKNGNN